MFGSHINTTTAIYRTNTVLEFNVHILKYFSSLNHLITGFDQSIKIWNVRTNKTKLEQNEETFLQQKCSHKRNIGNRQ